MRIVSLLALLVPSVATAVPLSFQHQGRVFDSAGDPIDGANDLRVSIWDAPASGAEVWGADYTGITFDNGFYSIALDGLDATDFDSDDLYVELSVNAGAPLPNRLPLRSVPFAIRAGHAASATDVTGGVVDATEVRINGTTVLDSSGLSTAVGWSDVTGKPQVVSDLSCSAGERAEWNGTTWGCADPAHTHDTAEVTSGIFDIARLPVGGSGTQVAAGDHSHAYGTLTGLPVTLSDMGSCADTEVLGWNASSSAWECAAAMVASDDSLNGDGSPGNPLSVNPTFTPSSMIAGRIIEAEGSVSGNTNAGAAAADATASGGEVRLGLASDTGGRLMGKPTGVVGDQISIGPALVTVRAKVADNTSASSIGYLNCTALRGGAWGVVGTNIALTPSSFEAADTWQEFSTWCDWAPDDQDQFVGWDGWADGGVTDVSIDYVQVTPGVKPQPQRWFAQQTADLDVGATITNLPGLDSIQFTLDAPSSVTISYNTAFHNNSVYTGQHCAIWMYLDGSGTEISNRGGYGTGFVMMESAAGEWWHHGTLTDHVNLPAGTHTLRIAGNENWGGSPSNCYMSQNYGGGRVTIEAYPQ